MKNLDKTEVKINYFIKCKRLSLKYKEIAMPKLLRLKSPEGINFKVVKKRSPKKTANKAAIPMAEGMAQCFF